jgi:hypothetical protein
MADAKISALPIASITTSAIVPFAQVTGTSVTSGTTFVDLKTQVQLQPTIVSPSITSAVIGTPFSVMGIGVNSVTGLNKMVLDTGPSITSPSILGADIHNSFSEYAEIANPAPPSSGNMRFYARNISGRTMPKWNPPSGTDQIVQPGIFNNTISMWTPNASATGISIGPGWFTPTGNFASLVGSYTVGSIYTTINRARYTNVQTTSVQTVGPRSLSGFVTTSSVANVGGFFFFARWGIEQARPDFSSVRAFVGLGNNSSVVSTSISAARNLAGFGWDTGDNSVLGFYTNDNAGAPTKIPITTKVSVFSGYDSYIFAKNGVSSVLYFRLDDINTSSIIAEGSVFSNLPDGHVRLFAQAAVSNGPYGQNSIIGIGVNKIYVETDL